MKRLLQWLTDIDPGDPLELVMVAGMLLLLLVAILAAVVTVATPGAGALLQPS